ncbi:MAG TPA: (Fe-S)-binding protein, partial [Pirellulales bacterium]|nr:(Fe-S)-binding protein [Pirellulales bacterium]
CCGRPLYDFGMLGMAKRLLREILDALRPQIQAGIPIVGLEPSCMAVFRDELINLFPDDEDAKRLHKQAFLLSEFLNKKVEGYEPPQLSRKALVHGHCHHKSIMGMEDEKSLLKKMGIDCEMPEPGCCGMAGSFGFEAGRHYDVSLACGEQRLLPAVRDADDQTLIIADGFSCQQQIAQATNRRATHLAEVLQEALHAQARPFDTIEVPKTVRSNERAAIPGGSVRLLLAGTGIAIASWLVWRWSQRASPDDALASRRATLARRSL